MNEVKKEMLHHQSKLSDKSRQYKVIERAVKYIVTIYNHNVGSKEEMERCNALRTIRDVIKLVPLPERERARDRVGYVTRTDPATGAEYQAEISSDIELDPPEDQAGWPRAWCDTRQEREVSDFIKNIIDSSITGPALEVVVSMGMPRDRTGFDTVERLCQVYGRNAGHITCLPTNFNWGNGSLVNDWTNYRQQLDGAEYLRLHPNNEPMMVQCAMIGFGNYNNSYRILDHIRTNAGENPSWADFKNCVDRFLGDTFRSQFETAMYRNHNGLQAMTAAGIIEKSDLDSDMVNLIPNQFKGKKAKGKGKGKNTTTPFQPKTDNAKGSPNLQSDNSKSKSVKKCAWCNNTSHPTYLCKNYGNGKWTDKKCNRCNGLGHPQEACINPPKKKKEEKKKSK